MGQKSGEFSTLFARTFLAGMPTAGRLPQEYEVDMLAAYHTEYLMPFS
jgi:hypothetical protein